MQSEEEQLRTAIWISKYEQQQLQQLAEEEQLAIAITESLAKTQPLPTTQIEEKSQEIYTKLAKHIQSLTSNLREHDIII